MAGSIGFQAMARGRSPVAGLIGILRVGNPSRQDTKILGGAR